MFASEYSSPTGACPAFTDSYLPAASSITESRTEGLYRRRKRTVRLAAASSYASFSLRRPIAKSLICMRSYLSIGRCLYLDGCGMDSVRQAVIFHANLSWRDPSQKCCLLSIQRQIDLVYLWPKSGLRTPDLDDCFLLQCTSLLSGHPEFVSNAHSQATPHCRIVRFSQ